MSNRIKPREFLQEPDLPLVGSFSGLSSASLNQTGDVVFADKLINATITKQGQIKKRNGSKAWATLTWFNGSTSGYEVYGFKFDNIEYRLVRTGTQLHVYEVEADKQNPDNFLYNYIVFKDNVFRNASLNERATFAMVVEGEFCHILIATPSTQLVSLTIMRRKTKVATKPSASKITFNINNYPITNVLNQDNTVIYSPDNFLITPTNVSQSGATVTYESSSSQLDWASVGSQVKMHSFFWLRYSDANYYPGLYLYNTAVRRNSTLIDVNVAVPPELYANPIFNEPQLQDLENPTYRVMKNNDATSATFYTFIPGNHQPTTEDVWDFSDGGYIPGPGKYTRPTPAYISFGALQSGGSNSIVYFLRARHVLIANGRLTVGDISQRVNKSPVAHPTYLNDQANAYVTDANKTPYYFDMTNFTGAGNAYPGVGLSSVVELIYHNTNTAGSGASATIADLEPDSHGQITINDGYIIPLYGYNAIARTNEFEQKYPPIVAAVGNRVILTGLDNLVAVSHADWSYRGVSFNNFQASTIAFSENSSYYVRLAGGSSVVKAITSVNGVLIAATDSGVFRISGSNPSTPPNASVANVARVSSELLPTSQCFIVYDSKVYYASETGFYQLQYSQDVDELTNQSLSSQVSNYFDNYKPISVSYSATLRSFLIGFKGTRELLVLNLDSETWSTYKMATTLVPEINQSFDGFVFKTTRSTDNKPTLLIATWTNSTSDLANNTGWNYAVIPACATTIYNYETDISTLVTPSELISTLQPDNVQWRLIQSTGFNNAMVTGADEVTITEHPGGSSSSLPIIASFVSKAFSSDRLNRAHRIRGVNVLLTGQGTLKTRIVFPTSTYDDRYPEHTTWLINTSGQHQGEPMLNALFAVRVTNGNTINLRFRTTGISEAWQFACSISEGLCLAGLQFDTSRKTLRRLR